MLNDLLRLPPQNVEAEQSILGALLLDNDALDTAIMIIGPDDFYKEAHGVIYQTMLAMQKDRVAIDGLTIIDRLKSNKRLSQVGGHAYIAELVNSVPNAANIRHHCKIVQDKALRRRIIAQLTGITEWAYDGETTETANVAEQLWKVVEDVADGGRKSAVTCLPTADLAQSTLIVLEKRFDNRGKAAEISTGIGSLDKVTSGLHNTELTIVAGRPGHGKTSLAMQIAANLAFFQNKSVAFFSMEMSKEELAIRLACCYGYVDGYKARSGYLSQEDWNSIHRIMMMLAESRLHIDDASFNTPAEIRAKCRRIKRKYGLDAIFADYLQLMNIPGKHSREQEIAEISRQGKALAKDMKVPVVYLAQLNRAVESRADNKPMLADLRESGAIEQDADNVLFVYRHDLKDKCLCDWQGDCTCGKRGKAEISIGKQRNGPAGVDIPMNYIAKYTRFEEKET